VVVAVVVVAAVAVAVAVMAAAEAVGTNEQCRLEVCGKRENDKGPV
jgi:hypothetical protein